MLACAQVWERARAAGSAMAFLSAAQEQIPEVEMPTSSCPEESGGGGERRGEGVGCVSHSHLSSVFAPPKSISPSLLLGRFLPTSLTQLIKCCDLIWQIGRRKSIPLIARSRFVI